MREFPISDIRSSTWTVIQQECYDRNYICDGCKYTKYTSECCVKVSLIEKIKAFGLSEDAITKGALAE